MDVEGDPLATRDPFLSLSAEELRTRWSFKEPPSTDAHEEGGMGAGGASTSAQAKPGGSTLGERLVRLSSMEETTLVDVHLSGFDGGGGNALLREDQLQRLLDFSKPEAQYELQHRHTKVGAHQLPSRRRLLYRVATPTPRLAERVASAVERVAADASMPLVGGSDTVRVPVSEVDRIVRDEYRRQHGSHVTIYLLNPRAPRRPLSTSGGNGTDAEAATADASSSATVRYAYFDDVSANESGIAVRHAVADGLGCAVTRWVGQDRYLWVDLSAGPVAYGPLAAGEDVVTEHTLPSMASLARRFASSSERSSHLAVELAALVTTTTRQLLLAVPIAWLPERHHTALTIVVVRVTDRSDAGPASSEEATARARQELEEDQQWEADVQVLQRELWPLAAVGQRVSMELADTTLEDCRLCAVALSSAIVAETVFVPSGGAAEPAAVAERRHVDSTLLAAGLRRFVGNLPGLHARRRHSGERVLPLVLYSVASAEPLLLDGQHVSVPFRDLVVAVQTRPTAAPLPTAGAAASGALAPAPAPASPPAVRLEEHCGGVPLSVDASRVRRPLLASLLKTGWGVATDVTWSAAHNASATRRLWAIGRSPHGPYSAQTELSFALRDAARRAPVLALAAEVLGEVAALGRYYAELGTDADDVLGPAEHLPFLRRLNVLSFKLQRARFYLSLQNFRHSRFYLLSTRHDLRAMRTILEAAGAAFKSARSAKCDHA